MALDRQRIVAEAVDLLDTAGLDGLTLRKLAQRLDVRAPTLYWHLANKAALVTAVAEEILRREFPDPAPPGPDERWQDWLTDQARGLRRAMLAHRDGARVISAAQLSLNLAGLAELAMNTLVERGIPLHEARLLVLTVRGLTIGYVLEEQAPQPDEKTSGFDLDTFTERFPTLVAGIAAYFEPGRTVDDLFEDCLRLVVDPPTR